MKTFRHLLRKGEAGGRADGNSSVVHKHIYPTIPASAQDKYLHFASNLRLSPPLKHEVPEVLNSLSVSEVEKVELGVQTFRLQKRHSILDKVWKKYSVLSDPHHHPVHPHLNHNCHHDRLQHQHPTLPLCSSLAVRKTSPENFLHKPLT